MLAPVLDRLATEFSGRARIVKVNVDTEPQLASRFQVSSIPTLVFIANGKVAGQTAGAAPEASLRGALNQLTSSVA
jgi:thioredoxin 1